jgi:hypothetical protein
VTGCFFKKIAQCPAQPKILNFTFFCEKNGTICLATFMKSFQKTLKVKHHPIALVVWRSGISFA